MLAQSKVTIEAEDGKTLDVQLSLEGGRLGACLRIDGIPHHLERVSLDEMAEYHVDSDPDYVPRADPRGFCYIVVPFSK